MPYGTPGVDRAPEGQARAPGQTLQEADRLLRAGRPFHAHEVFEDAWKSSTGDARELWRGLAQLAVGLTHLARGYPDRAAHLIDRGAQSLSRYRDLIATDDTATEGSPPEPGPPVEILPLDVAQVQVWAADAAQRCRDAPSATALELAPMPLSCRGERLLDG